MTNTKNSKNKKPLFQRLGEFFYIVYLITLYLFVDRDETLVISNIAFILFAGCTLFVLIQRKRIYIGKKILTAYIAFTWMYATTFWSINSYLANERMNTMWLLFILFFLTYNLFYEKEDAHAYLLKGLYIAGIALIIYSIKTYGISEVIDMMSAEGGVRLGSEINQENSFGMMNAITIIIAFYYLLYKKSYKLLHVIVIAGAFLFAMSSGSRKALLMMCLGVLFLIYKRYGIKKLYKVIAVGVVVVLLFMMVIKLPMFDLIRGRMESTFDSLNGESMGDSSQRLRSRMIATGWELFKDRMLIGYGANNFCILSGYGTYAHNNFIEILVDFGLVGFILYYLIYLIAVKKLWESKQNESKVLLIILLIRLMMEMAMVTYYSKQQWVILAFAMIHANTLKSPAKENLQEEVALESGEEYKEDKGDLYEPEKINGESDENDFKSQPCDTVPSEQGENSALDYGQGISSDEVPCNNGEETQS